MSVIPDPWWPVVVLAAICLGDAILCVRPVAFVAQCLTDVGFPRRAWWALPVIKTAAALGLVAGLWVPVLGLVTAGCLVAYFVVAITLHLRARDLGRNLFLNATGMLVICIAVLLWCFVL